MEIVKQIEVYKYVITPLFSLIGVLLGVAITSLLNWRLKSKEAKLKIVDKLTDKKILAYESVLKLGEALTSTASTQTVKDGFIQTYPLALHNKESFSYILNETYVSITMAKLWIGGKIYKELHLTQEYLNSLNILLSEKEESKYPEIGLVLRSDLLDIGNSLNQMALKYFEKDIYSLKPKPSAKLQLYSKGETQKRFGEFILSKEQQRIKDM